MDSKNNAATSSKPSMAFTLVSSWPEIRIHMGEIAANIKTDFMQADIYCPGLILLTCCEIPMNEAQILSEHKEKKHDKEVKEMLEEIRKNSV